MGIMPQATSLGVLASTPCPRRRRRTRPEVIGDREQLVDARFQYNTVLFDGEFALLQWGAEAKDLSVSDGADSFCPHLPRTFEG